MRYGLAACFLAVFICVLSPRALNGQMLNEKVLERKESEELVYRLKKADASWAANKLGRLIGKKPAITIEVQKESNSVLIRADKEATRRAVKFLDRLDAEIGDIGLFVLELTKVDAGKVGRVLRITALVLNDEHMTVTIDAKTNSVILRARKQSLQVIEQMFAGLGLLKSMAPTP